VHQVLLTAEIRKRRVAASCQINLLDALRRMTGAVVGERDARCDRHPAASKNPDEFSASTAAATHASRAGSVKPNREATRLESSQGPSPRELKRVQSASQSA